jgi:hypothetical protein
MKRFVRQKAEAPNVEINFGAASTKIPRTVEPNTYRLKLNGARVFGKNGNVLIALDVVDTESGDRIETRPLWVDGPNKDSGDLVYENQHIVAQLLTLANLPTIGNVSELIPKLAGLEFDAQLGLGVDNRDGRSFNSIIDVFANEDASVS